MPTQLHRIQVLLQPEDAARVKTLAKMENRTHSSMCADLIVSALRLPKFRDVLDEAEELGMSIPAKKDPRRGQPQTQWKVEQVATNSHTEVNFTQDQLQAIAEQLLRMTNDQQKEQRTRDLARGSAAKGNSVRSNSSKD